MTAAATPVWDIQVELRAEPQLLQAVRKLVQAYASAKTFTEERCHEIVLAVDEACTNMIRHSYVGYRGGVIVIRLGTCNAWLVVTLEDFGRTAPPEQVRPRPAAPESVDREALQPGGLGVQLMYTVFDEVQYTPRENGGNRIQMRLRLPEQTEGVHDAP